MRKNFSLCHFFSYFFLLSSVFFSASCDTDLNAFLNEILMSQYLNKMRYLKFFASSDFSGWKLRSLARSVFFWWIIKNQDLTEWQHSLQVHQPQFHNISKLAEGTLYLFDSLVYSQVENKTTKSEKNVSLKSWHWQWSQKQVKYLKWVPTYLMSHFFFTSMVDN